MANIVFLETFANKEDFQKVKEIKMTLESLITYCVYKYCSPKLVSLKLVSTNIEKDGSVTINADNLEIIGSDKVPWQVASCIYPVVLYEDTVITGLCAVARHICKHKTSLPNFYEHEGGLLGFRKSCLQAPNEVSIWTKFCEVDLITTVKTILESTNLKEVPKTLVRFENHLKKPVRVHNIYKIARDIKKININTSMNKEDLNTNDNTKEQKDSTNSRIPKLRKWKSKQTNDVAIDCSIGIEDLNITHQFAEGPFLTLADLILLPSYHIIIQSIGDIVQSLLPFTYKWYKNVIFLPEIQQLIPPFNLQLKPLEMRNVTVPTTADVSLYKCDPKRHNPKKRLFTKEDDIIKALSSVTDDMELKIGVYNFEDQFNWKDIPDGANPTAGHLPDERVERKAQQLKNLTLPVLKIAKEGDLIVDFCSGSGHLGILIAYLLPKCTVILLENKEQSLMRARVRVHEMGLKNIYFFQCNLDFFIGKFDIGIALHACGIASDLVLDKCLKANAKFVLCPCCYGSLHATDRLIYPRSNKFSNILIDQYLCIGHAADQTHEEHPLAERGARCMAIIDSDRGRLAEEFGYKVTLSRLKPLTCTPKNNLLIGVPS